VKQGEKEACLGGCKKMLSPNSIRAANIERNRLFLANLFGSSEVAANSVRKAKKQSSNGSRKTGKNASKEFSKQRKWHSKCLSLLCHRFLHRSDFISKLLGYLSCDFVRAAALLVQGPSGAGKTSICHAALDQLFPFSYARVMCDGYSTSKQLLKAIWFAVLKVKFHHISNNNNKHQQGSKVSIVTKMRKSEVTGGGVGTCAAEGNRFAAFVSSLGVRPPSNFGDLVTLLGPIVDSILGTCHSSHSTSSSFSSHEMGKDTSNEDEGKISMVYPFGIDPLQDPLHPRYHSPRAGALHILLDRIDSADAIEKGLASKLLRLTELAHPRIKVLG